MWYENEERSEDDSGWVAEGMGDSLLLRQYLHLSHSAHMLWDDKMRDGELAVGALRDVVVAVVGACGDAYCHPSMDYAHAVDPGDDSLARVSHTPANYFQIPLLPYPSFLPPSCCENPATLDLQLNYDFI